MEEFELVNNFFSKLSKHNVSALGLNEDVFFVVNQFINKKGFT